MRIRLSLELRVGRDRDEREVPQFEHRDIDTLVENQGHPRYVGFAPEEVEPWEDRGVRR